MILVQHCQSFKWYHDTRQDLSSIVITRQARHDLLEKYRPRILMTEAELAEDAVIINVDDIIIAHHVKSTV